MKRRAIIVFIIIWLLCPLSFITNIKATIAASPGSLIGESKTFVANSDSFQRKSFYAEKTGVPGLTWAVQTPSYSNRGFLGIGYGNGRFVAVGWGERDWPVTHFYGDIYVSSDGENWKRKFSINDEGISGVVYGNGQFVAVGVRGSILTSPDGENWSKIPHHFPPLYCIAYGNGIFVAAGPWNTLVTSPDGQTWTNVDLGYIFPSCHLDGITYHNGMFVTVGQNALHNDLGVILTSPDGVSWFKNTGSFKGLRGVSYGQGKFVAVGVEGSILTSRDGLVWEEESSGVSKALLGVIYGGDVFVAVGSGGTILTSPDGDSWKIISSGTSNDLQGVTFGNSKFAVIGNNNTILNSPYSARFWVFYSDGQEMVYKTSENGIRWSLPTTVRHGCAYGEQFSVWFDGTYVHYAFAEGSMGAPVYYNRGKANADGTINWDDSEKISVPGISGITYSIPCVSADSDGYPWIGYRKVDGTNKRPMITKNSKKDGNWSTATGFPYDLAGWTAAYWMVAPVPLTDGKMLAIYTSHGHLIRSKSWNGTTWLPRVVSPNPNIGVNYFSAVAYDDDVHVAFLSNTTLLHIKYTYSTNSWGTETRVIPQPVTPTSAPVLSIDSEGDLHLFWAGAPKADRIYYKQNSGGKWDAAPLEWIDESTEKLAGNDALTGFYRLEKGKGLFYVTKKPGQTPVSYQVKSNWGETSIAISKTGPAGAHSGNIIPYEFTVKNTGNVDLKNVSVTDSLLGGVIESIGLLPAGDSVSFQIDYTIPSNVSNPLVNTAVASGAGTTTATDSDSHSLLILDPSVIGTTTAQPDNFYPFLRKSFYTGLIGETWTARNSGTQNWLYSVAYGKGKFVAVGWQGTLLTSADGETWTPIILETKLHLFGVAYGNGLFVAVGYVGLIFVSHDGVTWTKKHEGTMFDDLWGVAYGNGLWVAVAENGTIFSSKNGEAWTKTSTGITWRLRGVAYGNGEFVAVGNEYTILTSANGVNWRQATIGDWALTAVAYGNGVWVAVGENGTVATSSYGGRWVMRHLGLGTNWLRGVTYANGTFFMVGDSGLIFTSRDGEYWTQRTSGSSNKLWTITYGQDTLMVVGGYGTVLTSLDDGRFWVFYSDGRDLVYKTSKDGFRWNESTPAIVRTPCSSEDQFSVWFDNTNVHYAYASGSPGAPIYYRRGLPHTDGRITWTAPEQIALPGASEVTYRIPSISADIHGSPWIGYRKVEGSNTLPMVTTSSQTDGSWATADGFPYDLAGRNATDWVVAPLPLQTGQTLVLYSSPGQPILARKWNKPGWTTELATNRSVNSAYFSAVSGPYGFYLAYLSGTDILYTIYSHPGHVWFPERTVRSSVNPSSAPVLSIDLDEHIIFWAGSPKADHIYFTKTVEFGWNEPVLEWLDENNEKLTSNASLSIPNNSDNRRGKGLFYLTGKSSPYKVK